jgi:hypothetical protein
VVGLVPAVPLAAGPVPAPVERCAVDDPRLVELSGLAVVGDGLWAMADGGRRVELLRLDPDTCAVLGRRTADVDPYDAEDLAAAPDGSIWVGDTGDNDRRRPTVAVIVVPPRGAPELQRMVYPDGPHDAEALLVDANGMPTIVTKEIGAAGIYRPDGALTETGPTPLVHAGDLVLPSSDTAGGPIGGFGSRTVTGGAVSADGRVVALRTYTDAWLFAVADTDRPDAVAAALRGTPVRVPLPDEPQGEALAFTADGTLLSGSESRGGATGQIRAVPGAAALAALASSSAPSSPAPAVPVAEPVAEPAPAWRSAAIGAAALVGVLGLLAAAMARQASRRR